MKHWNYSSIGSFVAAIILTIILFGCKDNVVAPVEGNVSGSITYLNSEGKTASIPGIKIYLLDADFKADTVNYSNNKKAFLDSTITDSNGNYKFANLKEGNYGLVPLPGAANYKFSHDKSSDPYTFSVNNKKQSYVINFTAPDPMMGTATTFGIKIVMKNFPRLEKGWYFIISIKRVEYILFTPTYDFNHYNVKSGDEVAFSNPLNFNYNYGYTNLFYTLTNKFEFDFSEGWPDENLNNVYRNEFEFNYDLTLSFCPSSSTFEYDWTNHTFNRIQ